MQRRNYIFVDCENVHDIDVSLIDQKPVQLILVLGKNQKNLPVELVKAMLPRASQITLVQSCALTRNALDLVLAETIGRIRGSDPHGFFHVVSGDKDFDGLITYLKAEGTLTHRHAHLSQVPVLQPQKDLALTFIERLKADQKNRPTKRLSLISRIKNHSGNTLTDAAAEDLVAEFCTSKQISISENNRVQYHI